MTYQDFVFKLQLLEFPVEALLACEDFVNEEMRDWNMDEPNRLTTANFDFGFAELADIVNQEQSRDEIANSLTMATMDFDSLGRNITKMRYKQLCANPHKRFKRLVLKSYYLHKYNINEEVTKKVSPFDPGLWTIEQFNGAMQLS